MVKRQSRPQIFWIEKFILSIIAVKTVVGKSKRSVAGSNPAVGVFMELQKMSLKKMGLFSLLLLLGVPSTGCQESSSSPVDEFPVLEGDRFSSEEEQPLEYPYEEVPLDLPPVEDPNLTKSTSTEKEKF